MGGNFTVYLVSSSKSQRFIPQKFHLKSAKVYFRKTSQDEESNVYVIKYVYSSSMTRTLLNHVTTSIYMEGSEESFKKWRNRNI